MYAEPVKGSSEPVWLVYSNDAILAEYWEHWLTKMNEFNKKHGVDENKGCNPLQCIDDWVTVHWAVPANIENLLNIISAPKPELIDE